jgi:hypothetical protein
MMYFARLGRALADFWPLFVIVFGVVAWASYEVGRMRPR